MRKTKNMASRRRVQYNRSAPSRCFRIDPMLTEMPTERQRGSLQFIPSPRSVQSGQFPKQGERTPWQVNKKGYVWREGDSWYIRFRDARVVDGQVVRKQMARKLCRVLPEHSRLTRPPACVKQEAIAFMENINKSEVAPERMLTIGDFVAKVYKPHIETRHARSTVHHYTYYLEHILVPRCGAELLRDFHTPKAKRLVDSIARDYPEMKKSSLKRLRSLLSAIFKLAIQEGYKPAPNPMRELTLPRGARSQETYAYDLDSVFAMLRRLAEPDRTLVATAAFTGLRKGELKGLQWEDYDGATLTVNHSMWRGFMGEPKSDASRAAVPVIPMLRGILDEHRMRSGNPGGFVFRGPRLGHPINPDNIAHDRIRPVLNRCLVCGKAQGKPHVGHLYQRDPRLPSWHGWHAFRRGLATNLHAMGIDDMTIQKIMRHTDVAITQKCYIKTLPSAVGAAMAKFDDLVCSKSAEIVQ